MDEGLSLDTIVGVLRRFLPTISYYINMVNRLLDIFSSYIGFGTVEEDTTEVA